MRHRRAGYRLGRTTAHRAATLRHLALGLFEHGQITTTIPRAKAVQPMIEKIEVKKVAKVRRAKLFFLRGRQGKSARMIERFTNADEFAVAVAPVAEQAKPAEAPAPEAPAAEEAKPAEQPSA